MKKNGIHKKFLKFKILVLLTCFMANCSFAQEKEVKDVKTKKEEKISQKKENKQSEKLKEKDVKEEKLNGKDKDSHKEKEENLQQKETKKEKKIVKEFKLKDYEHKDFDVKVFIKAQHKYLEYTHKKTKAKVVVSLFKNQKDFERDEHSPISILFRYAPCEENFIKAHSLEHLLATTQLFDNYAINLRGMAETYENKICFTKYKGDSVLESLKELISQFKDPTFLKDKGKLFRQEVYSNAKVGEKKFSLGRVYFESLEKHGHDKIFKNHMDDIIDNKRGIDGANLKIIKSMTIEKIKEFFKKYIHPSNSLTTIEILSNHEDVKEILDILCGWYNKYSYRKYDEKDFLKGYFKSDAPYLEMHLSKNSDRTAVYKAGGKEKKCKFCSEVRIRPKEIIPNFKACYNDVLPFLNLDFLGEDFAKKELGYESVNFRFGSINSSFPAERVVEFIGDDEKQFTKEALQQNTKKLFKKIHEKLKELKSVSKEKFDNVFLNLSSSSLSKKSEKERQKIRKDIIKSSKEKLKDGYYYNDMSFIKNNLQQSFLLTGEPFSEVFFDMKNNKIKSDLDQYLEGVRKNLDIYEYLYKPGVEKNYIIDKYILSSKKGNTPLKQKKISQVVYIAPIKFKEESKDRYINRIAKGVLTKYLIRKKVMNYSYGLVEEPDIDSFPFISAIGGVTDYSKEILSEYFKKDFSKDLKNYELKKEDLKKYLQSYLEDVKANLENIKIYMSNEYEKFKKEHSKILKGDKKNIKILDCYDLKHIILELKCKFIDKYPYYDDYKKRVKEIKNFNKLKKEVDDLIKKIDKIETKKDKKNEALKNKILKKTYKLLYAYYKDIDKKAVERLKHSEEEIKKFEEYLKERNESSKEKVFYDEILKVIKSAEFYKKRWDVKKFVVD